MTKTQQIAKMIKAGWSNSKILENVDTTRRYIGHVRWLLKNPERKEYKRQWMADKRALDPMYIKKERAQQKKYRVFKKARGGGLTDAISRGVV